jgi:hypothetical protein
VYRRKARGGRLLLHYSLPRKGRKYSCEDEIKKDIAIAIYSSRPAKEKKFSISIPVVEDVAVENKPKTREQRIKEYIGK